MSDTLSEKAQAYAVLKEHKERFEHIVTLLNIELSKLGEELFNLFMENGVASFKIDGSEIFKDRQDRILSPDVKFKGTIADETALFNFLRAHGHGSLIKESVHAMTLEGWIKHQKEENAELPDESVLKIWSLSTTKIRRAPKSAKPKGGK